MCKKKCYVIYMKLFLWLPKVHQEARGGDQTMGKSDQRKKTTFSLAGRISRSTFALCHLQLPTHQPLSDNRPASQPEKNHFYQQQIPAFKYSVPDPVLVPLPIPKSL